MSDRKTNAEAYEKYRIQQEEDRRAIQAARAELSKYRACRECLEKQLERISRLDSRINAIVKPLKNPDEYPDVQTQSDPKGVEELLCRTSDLRRLYRSKALYAGAVCLNVEKAIAAANLSERQADILEEIFITGGIVPNLKAIAERYHYSRSRFYALLDRTLLSVGKKQTADKPSSIDYSLTKKTGHSRTQNVIKS